MRLSFALLVFALATGCSDSADTPQAPEVPADAPVADTSLELRFPAEMFGLERRSLDTSVDAAMGESVTNVTTRYGSSSPGSGEPGIEVYLTQYGDSEMAEMMGLSWATRGVSDAPDGTEVQPTEEFDGHPARRTWDSATKTGRLQVVADGTLLVEVRGANVPEEALDAAARAGLTAPE